MLAIKVWAEKFEVLLSASKSLDISLLHFTPDWAQSTLFETPFLWRLKIVKYMVGFLHLIDTYYELFLKSQCLTQLNYVSQFSQEQWLCSIRHEMQKRNIQTFTSWKEDFKFIKTAQTFIASTRYHALALTGLSLDITPIYIPRKSSENALIRMPPCP